MDDIKQLIDQLSQRLKEVVADAPELTEVLRGTVRERFVRCGKQGCHCQEGTGHGPIYYFSVTLEAGRSKQMTLTKETYERAQRYVNNYAHLRSILEEVSSLNREILYEVSRTQRKKRTHKKEE